MKEQFEELRNGVILAELGGHGDGPYCARYGAGGALVIMGTYVIDASDNVPYPREFVFKPDPGLYTPYLEKHIQLARGSGAKVGVSAISIELSDTIDFLVACQRGGADYVSLCAYSVMEMFTSKGLGCELPRRACRDKLKEWTQQILSAVTVPFIFKLGFIEEPDALEAVDILTELGVPIIHAVGDAAAGSEGLRNLNKLANRCRFLIGGGGVDDINSARQIIAAGAGAVAVATAAMKDPLFIGRLQSQLRSTKT